MNLPDTLNRLNSLDIILASKSPRRQQLLTAIGLKFRTVNHLEMDEVFPSVLRAQEIPLYLARAKALHYESIIEPNTLLITADTIVWLEDEVIGKPIDASDAENMLARLSGKMHEVFTGVCLKTTTEEKVFYDASKVYFRNLSDDEIRFYVDTFKPLDKAGAYGIQEWIGYVGVERIEGSYYNIMGLPIQKLYNELIRMTDQE